MSTLELKSYLHNLIDQVNDDAVLQAYMVLLSREVSQQQDFWDELSPDQKESVDRGIADLEVGRKKSFSEILKKYQ